MAAHEYGGVVLHNMAIRDNSSAFQQESATCTVLGRFFLPWHAVRNARTSDENLDDACEIGYEFAIVCLGNPFITRFEMSISHIFHIHRSS